VPAVDHAELHMGVRQVFFGDRSGDHVQAPAVWPRLERVQVDVPVEGGARIGVGVGWAGPLHRRVLLREAVEDDVVAVLVGIDEVQRVGRLGLEPANLIGPAVARDDGEARRQLAIETREVNVLLQQLRVPEQREVVEDRVVLGKRHVMRQPGSWQRNFHPVDELTCG